MDVHIEGLHLSKALHVLGRGVELAHAQPALGQAPTPSPPALAQAVALD